MTALQLAIGTTNDLVDAERDTAAERPKPIPSGLVRPEAARVLACGAGLAGLGLAATVGPGVLGVAAVGFALGLAYDLALRSRGLGWLAFVLGLPLVPIYGWLGGAGSLPAPILLLAAAAAPAGFGLAVANGRPDAVADRRSGTPSLALRLERRGPVAIVVAYGVAFSGLGAGLATWGGGGAGLGLVGVGVGVLAVGLAVPPAVRAWEIQAVGLAVVGVGWLAALRMGGAL